MFKSTTDKLDITDIEDVTDMGYTDNNGGFMSRLLINESEERRVQGLLSNLKKKTEGQASGNVEIQKSTFIELVGLIELVLNKKPIVLEEDLSPTQAGEIAGISRASIMNMLKSGTLRGYEVGTHWRVTKDSLLQYISEREKFGASMAEMDKAGFGFDE